MARVLALTKDLLFGSRVQADLVAAGNAVELISDPARLAGRLGGQCDVLIVDLTDPELDGSGLVEEVIQKGDARAPTRAPARILGFYAHIDTAVRAQAEQAGFDLVVPRSRMAREGAELVRRLAG